MNDKTLQLKLSFILGLRDVVFEEIKQYPELEILSENDDSFYVKYIEDFNIVKNLRSISRVYLVSPDPRHNPLYISNHKFVLGKLVETVVSKSNKNDFNTFKIYCAGPDSLEVFEIERYLEHNLKLKKSEDADLKIYIIKISDTWELGLQITPRPLSLRSYKVRHVNGAMDPTIAYSLNSLCELEKYETYLNVFSGSATLMIEAGQCYDNLQKIVGFDNNKEHLSLSVQNIREAGLIKKVQIREGNIFDKPNFGKFDVITSDLPFGMAVSKGEDLEGLYKVFIEYVENYLNKRGKLGVYTSEFKLFESLVSHSKFVLEKEVRIKLMTSEEQYLPIKLMIFSFK
ncbi:MAG: methyltransferase domain-containing protein [Candidatus Paceibacterota bacterium]